MTEPNADGVIERLEPGETAGPFRIVLPDWLPGYLLWRREVYDQWPWWRRRFWDCFHR